MSPEMLKALAKFGPVTVLLFYLVYFMTNTMSQKMDKMIEGFQHATQIHEEMLTALKDIRYSIKADNGITFRNNASDRP